MDTHSRFKSGIVCKPLWILLAALSVTAAGFALPQTTSTGTSSNVAAKPTTSQKVPTKTRVVKRRRARQRAQTAPTAARISEIQSALAAQGMYKGQPNGRWDTATMQGMRDFQSAHGLTVTGKLDALTLQKLGLGSEIAGRAAPLALPQSQGASASTSQQTP